MPNWPQYNGVATARGCLSPGGSTPLSDLLQLSDLAFSLTVATWTANRVVYLPVVCEKPVTVTDIGVIVTTQAGNLDVGIYDWNGTKIVTSGSTAVAAAGFQSIAIADTALAPGWYYLAFWCDSSTAVFRNTTLGTGLGRICGLQEQNSVTSNLPTPTATFETYAIAVAPLMVASYSATF